MSINRAPFNALVDDAGTGMTGTPWNKQAIKDVILDPVDAALVAPWTLVQPVAAAVDYADWDPGIVGHTIIYVTIGNAAMTIYSFKPATPAVIGQRILVHSLSDASKPLNFFHEHSGSSPNCLLHLRKSPVVTINGFWAFAEFQYGVLNGAGGWVLGAYGNGFDAALVDREG